MRRVWTAALTAAAVTATIAVATPAQAATGSISTAVSQYTYHSGEGVVITGGVKVGGAARSGVKVTLVRVASSGKESSIATTKTSSTGRYALPMSPTGGTARYYVKASSPALKGRTVKITWTRDGGGLREREKQIASRLGTPKTGLRTVSAATTRKADSSASRIRYRDYSKGMLVEVTRKGVTRTWFVPSKIRNRLLATGGFGKTFGVPRRDARCVVIESGCVQTFSKVTVYQNASKKTAYYQAGTSRRSQLLAVARSQVGYDEPGWRKAKYNKWAGLTGPWCATFVAWVAAASGNPGLVENRGEFGRMVAYAKAEMRTYGRGSKKYSPRPGTLVFFDNYRRSPKKPSHAGIYLGRSGKNGIRVIEGNSSPGATFTSDRGVHVHTRSLSTVVFYADPAW